MKIINLFVACPQDSDSLKKYKEDIKKLCHKLNEEYAEEYAEKKLKEQVKIIPVTYDDPERREEVCKQIIKYRADIVLFLFDNVHDECLLEELKVGVKRSKNFHKPEPLVFVKADENATNDKSKDDLYQIKEVLADGGWLYELFTNTDDLWPKVRYKIDRFVHSYQNIRELRQLTKMRYFGLRGLAIGLPIIIPLIIWLAISLKKAESKRLLIIGGGSARAFIEDSIFHKQGSLSTKFWLYAPLPSGDAYRMMAEEVINIHNTDYKSHPYFPIIISAGKAKGDSDFRRTISPELFIDKGIVIGIYLGDDYLVAYDGNQAIDNSLIGANSTIEASVLNGIIAKQDSLLRNGDTSNLISIFTTNNNSGTLNSYRDNGCYNIVSYITICDSLKHGRVFSDIDSLSKQTSCHKWIALGSDNYRPKDSVNVAPLVVHDNNGNSITKPVYVYFMLYKDEHNDTYVLPKATKGFVEILYNKHNNKKNIKESFESFINRIYDTINNNNQNRARILYDNFTLSHE